MYMEPLSTESGAMRVRRNIVPVMTAMIATCRSRHTSDTEVMYHVDTITRQHTRQTDIIQVWSSQRDQRSHARVLRSKVHRAMLARSG